MNKDRMSNIEILRSYGIGGKGYSIPDNSIIKTVKALHLLSATAWAGGALSMQALAFLKFSTSDAATVALIQYCLRFVDTCVVMPGLAGAALTGLFFSIYTSIGFFKFAWIGFKWCICLCAGFWGTLFWLPYGDNAIAWLATKGLDFPLRFIRSFILPESMWQGALQLTIIITMLMISVFRPLSFRQLYRDTLKKMKKKF